MKNNIEVTIKLFAQYREGKFKVQTRNYPAGTTAGDIIKDVGIDEDKLEIGVIMINGRHIDKDYELNDNVTISIFPKVGGG